jgi:FMN-dependent NADH-azoreductase
MGKLLYIQASPRVGRSHSLAVADAFVESYRENNPDDEIVTLDLFKANLLPFDGLAVQAKYTILHGQKHSQEELDAWKAVEVVIEEFKSADKYVMAVPMWNFGIPYPLKHYIDIILQPGYTFSYTPEEGYKGLVTGKPIFIAYARGGEYPPGSDYEAFDLQKKYLELILGFYMGFTDIRSIVVEPTVMGGPEVAKAKREAAIEKAKQMAKEF